MKEGDKGKDTKGGTKYESNRKNNPDIRTSRFDDVYWPEIKHGTEYVLEFDDYPIRFIRTLRDIYVCVHDVRRGTEYNVHEATEDRGTVYIAYQQNDRTKEPLRYFNVKDCVDTDIFSRPSVLFKRFIRWYKMGFTGNLNQPEVPALRQASLTKALTMPVVDTDTFIKKNTLLLNALSRYEITRLMYINKSREIIQDMLQITNKE